MSDSVPALALEEVSKRYGRICAVDRLSLEVPPGRMAGFLGPNGAGKSTTLYMIPRLVRPGGGRIRIFGVDVARDFRAALSLAGVMVEAPVFYEYLSGRLNLELAARLRGQVAPRELDEILERIGLADRQQDRVSAYSMGMKQRLGIGWALLGRPRLLVLDEPTNNLDPEGTQEVLSFLRERVKTQGLTVFLSSHLLHEVEEYCDTVHVIDRGRLVASGTVQEILRPHARIVRVTFQGRAPDAGFWSGQREVAQVRELGADAWEVTLAREDSAWLNGRLQETGFGVSAIAPQRKTLKDFFLGITGGRNDG